MEVKLKDIEKAITDMVGDLKKKLKLDVAVQDDLRPGEVIKSEILMVITGRLNGKLGLSIPLSCYPFFDDEKRKQLSIKEAAKKIFNLPANGK